MLQRSVLFLLLFSFFGTSSLFADSPLTSTDFWRVYEDVEAVQHARKSGKVDQKIAHFLASEYNDIDLKMAVCNALGWNFDGQDNHKRLLDYWKIEPDKKGLRPKRLKKLRGDQQMCLAYLMAMDDYFNPEAALPYIEQAADEMPHSYTAQAIRALIKGQIAMDGSWCEVWKAMEAVENNPKLRDDIRAEAKKIILDYMRLYQDECQ